MKRHCSLCHLPGHDRRAHARRNPTGAGFVDASGFHPIRAWSGYSPERAGEGSGRGDRRTFSAKVLAARAEKAKERSKKLASSKEATKSNTYNRLVQSYGRLVGSTDLYRSALKTINTSKNVDEITMAINSAEHYKREIDRERPKYRRLRETYKGKKRIAGERIIHVPTHAELAHQLQYAEEHRYNGDRRRAKRTVSDAQREQFAHDVLNRGN